MARLSASLMLFGLLGSMVAASPEYNQEEQNRNADCDNGCFFSSFPGGSCTNDAACMCTQQKYRERYFCCMAEKCAASVLPDSIQRQTSECEARNMEFTFDAEKVCGIKLITTTSSVSKTSTSTVTSDVKKSSATPASTSTPSTGDKTTKSSSISASQASSEANSTTTTNNAPQARAMLGGVAVLAVACGMFLL